MEKYDSTQDTLAHIRRVQQLMNQGAQILIERGRVHDISKLSSPEKELFDKYTPLLKDCTYGSEEYKSYLEGLKVALDNHYSLNSHHPEHYHDGLNGMDLFDIIEMFFDWKAAGERHADGSMEKSIKINKKRFDMSPQLAQIFRNTNQRMFVDSVKWKGYTLSSDGKEEKLIKKNSIKPLDIDSLGFIQQPKIWVGYDNYLLEGGINPEYGYFLHATLHKPLDIYLDDPSVPLEYKLWKIIIHRYYDEENPERMVGFLEQEDSKVVYEGFIHSREHLSTLLHDLGIFPQ